MHCELCGREIRRGFLIRIEGAVLVACDDCAERGEIIRRVYEREQRKPEREYTREEQEDVEEVLVDNYGRIIRRARESRGLSIQELAAKIGIKESTLRKIEDEKLVPPVDVARKLERVLGIRLYVKERTAEYKPEGAPKKELTLGDIVRLR